jgi:hypothetical protein
MRAEIDNICILCGKDVLVGKHGLCKNCLEYRVTSTIFVPYIPAYFSGVDIGSEDHMGYFCNEFGPMSEEEVQTHFTKEWDSFWKYLLPDIV